MSRFRPRRVRIVWTNGRGDWPTFELMDLRPGWVLLRGVADDEGHPHEGDRFWVPMQDIEEMVET